MMRRLILPFATLALVACSSEPVPQENAEDFASRIGEGGPPAVATPVDADKASTASAVPPAGADLTQLEKLGDIGDVDLGPRAGGCTLMVGSSELLLAGAPGDDAIPGKAVVRLGDSLTIADAAAGGIDALKSGTSFKGEGFTVTVAPEAGTAASRPATVTVRDAAGKTQSYSGKWTCS